MVDLSHGNSGKDAARQPSVCADVCEQIAGGDGRIFGVMIESNLVEGRQDYQPDVSPVYGQSITDGCVSFEQTVPMLEQIAEARRVAIRNQQ